MMSPPIIASDEWVAVNPRFFLQGFSFEPALYGLMLIAKAGQELERGGWQAPEMKQKRPCCSRCGFQSTRSAEEMTGEQINEALLDGKVIFAIDGIDGIGGMCALCAWRIVYVWACSLRWVSPDHPVAIGMMAADALLEISAAPISGEREVCSDSDPDVVSFLSLFGYTGEDGSISRVHARVFAALEPFYRDEQASAVLERINQQYERERRGP